MRTFLLYVQAFPLASKPYRIVETYLTCNGIRSRLSSLCFNNEVEAQQKVQELNMAEQKRQVVETNLVEDALVEDMKSLPPLKLLRCLQRALTDDELAWLGEELSSMRPLQETDNA